MGEVEALLRLSLDHLRACEETIEAARLRLPEDQQPTGFEVGPRGAAGMAVRKAAIVRDDVELALRFLAKERP